MEGHAKKCVERYCELANKTTEQLYKVSTPCIDDHHFKEEELKSVGAGMYSALSSRPYCRKRLEFITALQLGSQVYSYASSYEDSGSESGGQGMGKIGENFGVELDESQK